MNLYYVYTLDLLTSIESADLMHLTNFGNFYTREIYAIPIPTGFIPIPIPIPIMSRMAISIPVGFPWEWESHGVSHSHAHL